MNHADTEYMERLRQAGANIAGIIGHLDALQRNATGAKLLRLNEAKRRLQIAGAECSVAYKLLTGERAP